MGGVWVMMGMPHEQLGALLQVMMSEFSLYEFTWDPVV